MRRLTLQRWRRADRIAPALAALLVNALIGYALLMGLRGAPLLRAVAEDVPLSLFDLQPPVPEPPERARPARPPEAKPPGGAPPPAPARQPDSTPPRPALPALPAPAPVILVPAPVLPAAGVPAATGSGNGPARDNGTGNGSGSGGSGAGRGSGSGNGDGGTFSPARQTGGRFRNSDFPDWLHGKVRLKIGVRYSIGASGRVDKCEIIEKSGYAEVDDMTCRVIVERYRFRPARDPDGYAVTEVREEDYRWQVR